MRLSKFEMIAPPRENRFLIERCCLCLLDSRFRGNDGRQDWNDGRQNWNDGRQPFKMRLPCRLRRTQFVIARSDATRRSRWPRGVPSPTGLPRCARNDGSARDDGRQPFKMRLPCRLRRTQFVIARSDATQRGDPVGPARCLPRRDCRAPLAMTVPLAMTGGDLSKRDCHGYPEG